MAKKVSDQLGLDELFDDVDPGKTVDEEAGTENVEEKTEEKQEEKLDIGKMKDELRNELSTQYREQMSDIKSILSEIKSQGGRVNSDQKSDVNDRIKLAQNTLEEMKSQGLIKDVHVKTFEKMLDSITTIKSGGRHTKYEDVFESHGRLAEDVSIVEDTVLGANLASALQELKVDTAFNKQGSPLTGKEFIEDVFMPGLKNRDGTMDVKKVNSIKAAMRAQGAKNYLTGMYKEALGTITLDDSYIKKNKELVEKIENRKRSASNMTSEASVEFKKKSEAETKQKAKTRDDKVDDAMLSKISSKLFEGTYL